MTTATITETLALPADGSAATLGQTKVRLRLVAAVDGVAAGYTTGLTAVVEDAWTQVASSGLYSFTGVRPNSGASGDVITTPTGTVYELTVVYPSGSRVVRYLDVPDSAGPHAPASIETVGPTDLPRWALAGNVTQLLTDGDIETVLPDWTDASVATSAFDALAVLGGKLVVPSPETGGNTGTNAAGHGFIYKDFASLGAWTGTRVSVSGYWTGERPYEATPLLHVVTGTDEYGLGVWPISDFFSGIPGNQSILWFGAIGRNNTFFDDFLQDTVSFDDLPDELNGLTDEKRYKWELRSWDGQWSLWIDGYLVGDWLPIPTALLGSTRHGMALDNNQSDGNYGAGGARPANRGAFEGPFTVAMLHAQDGEPVVAGRQLDDALRYKLDARDLDAHTADTTGAHAATAISYAGATGISATNVETALDELASEKANLTGGTFTGEVIVNDGTGGKTRIGHTAATPSVGVFEAASDTQPVASLGVIFGEGAIAFGPGGSSAIDATILRTGVGQISTGTTKLTVPTAAAGTDALNRDTGDARYQLLDSDLTAIAALSTTAYGRALLALADAAAGRTALGLGSLATASTITSSNITDGTIVNADINAAAAIDGTKVNYATTDAPGAVEFATTAETQTGSAADRAITPAGLAATTATETRAGVVELATTAEATTGTDTARAVTPAGVDAYVDAVLAGNVTIGGDLLVDDDTVTVQIAQAKAIIKLETNGSAAFNSYVGSETQPRLTIGYLGAIGLPVLTFGPGGAAVPDTTFYRSGVGALVLVGTLEVNDATTATHALNRRTADARYEALDQSLNAQIGTSYTIVAGDKGKLVTLSNAAGITLYLPQDSAATFAVGARVDLCQIGAGQVTIAAGTGATVNATPGLKLRAQWSGATAVKRAANTWVVFGDLSA